MEDTACNRIVYIADETCTSALDLKSRKANQKMQEIQPLLSEIRRNTRMIRKNLTKTMELYRKHESILSEDVSHAAANAPVFALFAALRSISDDPNIAQYAAPFLD